MNRMKYAQYIAGAATACSVIGFLLYNGGSTFGGILLSVGFLIGMVSYVFGGFMTAVKMSMGIAKWGWLAFAFPYNMLAVFGAFWAAIFVFVFLPIIPVRKACAERGYY